MTKIMKKGYWGIIGLMTIGLFGCSSNPEFLPEQVLQQALDESQEPGAYYAEVEMKTTYGEGKDPELILMKEWASKDGKKRTEAEARDGSGKTVTVHDGARLIIYQPELKQAMVSDDPELLQIGQASPKKQAEQLLQMVQQTHEISAGGEDEIAGRSTYRLMAKAKDNTALLGDQELWIDKENWMVLKSVSTSGNIRTEMTYTKVELNPDIPADTFMLELPGDVDIQALDEMNPSREITMEEAVKSIGKTFLHVPEKDGLAISRIELTELQGELKRNEVNLDYRKDGIPYFSMSIFSSPENPEGEEQSAAVPGEKPVMIRGQAGVWMEMNDFRSLVWQEQGLNYSVMFIDPGLSLDEFQALADTMIPVQKG
ncbi:outer membrane lipoprotein carrier protein LolA [Paenibacillus thermoaerophilus]|uniref:Outer membrane lipoprotein carrier protein LolA n=1 Tax=Paenibacillus thermoaerophilus TaxID=1215385 RepID=A0ABW2V4D9_9BACL|nr:sigma-E factor regulatory protein RseB domain-containing protein [Paenibacillus thermoaerophilus]TMV16106.1 outer membrane lipoprotein carrier protein LolA [Paenibacillus thermoaerophilus]